MMNDPRAFGQAGEGQDPGLCATCVNARIVTSDRGSRFLLCRVSAVDPRFPKYPALPVRECAAYQPPAD
jgi:hypothetical protein